VKGVGWEGLQVYFKVEGKIKNYLKGKKEKHGFHL